VSTVSEHLDLRSRPRRVTRADIPVPFAPDLELAMLPDRAGLRAAIHATLGVTA
jgi:pyruvate dehydrogenase E1 component beta subunit